VTGIILPKVRKMLSFIVFDLVATFYELRETFSMMISTPVIICIVFQKRNYR